VTIFHTLHINPDSIDFNVLLVGVMTIADECDSRLAQALRAYFAQSLETKDNLVSALDFLRLAYNEMLAWKPVKAADEILAQVEAILRKDEKIPAYTVVAAIRIHGSISPDAKRKVLLFFPSG
jgi:hypothetical protein